VSHFDQLVADLLQAGMESIAPLAYPFTPNARGRLTERVRPTRTQSFRRVVLILERPGDVAYIKNESDYKDNKNNHYNPSHVIYS